jgi:hypothetical protein
VSSDLTACALDSNFLVRLLSVTVVPEKPVHEIPAS